MLLYNSCRPKGLLPVPVPSPSPSLSTLHQNKSSCVSQNPTSHTGFSSSCLHFLPFRYPLGGHSSHSSSQSQLSRKVVGRATAKSSVRAAGCSSGGRSVTALSGRTVQYRSWRTCCMPVCASVRGYSSSSGGSRLRTAKRRRTWVDWPQRKLAPGGWSRYASAGHCHEDPPVSRVVGMTFRVSVAPGLASWAEVDAAAVRKRSINGATVMLMACRFLVWMLKRGESGARAKC